MNGAATQVASRQFDEDFERLPPHVREHVPREIDRMGIRLATFPHRMRGSHNFRLRVGDHRVIYRFNLALGEIPVSYGHRREIYKF